MASCLLIVAGACAVALCACATTGPPPRSTPVQSPSSAQAPSFPFFSPGAQAVDVPFCAGTVTASSTMTIGAMKAIPLLTLSGTTTALNGGGEFRDLAEISVSFKESGSDESGIFAWSKSGRQLPAVFACGSTTTRYSYCKVQTLRIDIGDAGTPVIRTTLSCV